MKKIGSLLLLSLLFYSCGSNEKVSREVFEEVNKSMEIKKVNEAEVIQEALVWGGEISKQAQEELLSALQQAIEKDGVPGAIRFCNVKALPILENVGNKYGVEIRRVSFDYRNPLDQPSTEEEGILDAYVYNAENGIESQPNVQKIKGGEILLYTKAIQIPGALCLNCHGAKGKDISPETQKVLDELYPNDKAIGHQVGDLRGMWSIRIPKSELIKRM